MTDPTPGAPNVAGVPNAPNVPATARAGSGACGAADPSDGLPPALAAAVARLAPPAPTTAAQVEAVMRHVRARPVPARTAAWHRRPRRVPGWAGWMAAPLLAASVVVAVLRTTGRRESSAAEGRIALSTTAAPGAVAGGYAVRFRVAAGAVPTGSRHVAVVGDFNGWDLTATPLVRDPATHAWSVDVRLPAGRYVYAFVVDGGAGRRAWLPDPSAPLAPADDFGRQNSVLLVAPQYATADR